jgi:hypothetical protein
MMRFVEDESLGDSRIFFLRLVNRLGGDQGKTVTSKYIDDPVLGRESEAITKRWSRGRG